MTDETPALRNLAFILAALLIAAMLVMLWAFRAGNHADAVVTFELERDVSFYCEVADTDYERAKGLMHRDELEPDRGMLFVFDSPQPVSFWMKNTTIPLDIIFIDEAGIVLNIAEASPEPGIDEHNLTVYRSAGPAKWVLEINQGLSRAYGISPGTKVKITLNT